MVGVVARWLRGCACVGTCGCAVLKTCHVCAVALSVVAACLWVIGPHVIFVRCFAQQGTAWGMFFLLAGIGVRSLVLASWVRWFYFVAYSMRIACQCVDCVLSWKEKRAHKVCILIILMCLCLP